MTGTTTAPNLNDPKQNTLEVAEITDQFVVELHTEDSVNPLFATPDRAIAQQFIDGQFTNKEYGIAPLRVVHALPPVTFYFTEYAKIGYGSDGPVRTWPMEDAGFCGLFPREQPIDQTITTLTGDSHTGWLLRVSGWDQEQVKNDFKELLDQALEMRTARTGVFADYRIPAGTTIRTEDGDILIRIRPTSLAETPYWRSSNDDVVPDRSVDLFTVQYLFKP